MQLDLLKNALINAILIVIITSILSGTSLTSVVAEASAAASSNFSTATPIKHIVVIFQENVSFDHYFATYPNADNTDGQTFNAAPGTPAVDGLSGTLLSANP